MFITVDKHQCFNSIISQTISIRLKHLSINTEKSFVSIFKFANYFFTLGYDVFSMAFGLSATQHRIVQLFV